MNYFTDVDQWGHPVVEVSSDINLSATEGDRLLLQAAAILGKHPELAEVYKDVLKAREKLEQTMQYNAQGSYWKKPKGLITKGSIGKEKPPVSPTPALLDKIADVLSNDENSSDEEMIDFFRDEFELPTQTAIDIVKGVRNKVLQTPLLTTKQIHNLIKKYF